MEISVSDIVSEVKICIDEIGLNDAEFLGTQDNEEMDTIIKSKISEALRFVNGNADWGLLEPNKIITDGTLCVGGNPTVRVVSNQGMEGAYPVAPCVRTHRYRCGSHVAPSPRDRWHCGHGRNFSAYRSLFL